VLGDSQNDFQNPIPTAQAGQSMDQPSSQRPVIVAPSDFRDTNDFLADMRQKFYDDIQFDRLNREAALEDMRFFVGDQWDDIVRQKREAGRKPVLTVNRLPAFVAQVVGNRRLNETDIKVKPDNGGTIAVARVREGLMRSVQKLSFANTAYDKALECQVVCGIGNFQVELDYEDDDVFEQTMKVVAINDALAVVWDRMLADPTGRDAGHVFVVDTMTKKEFYKRWPWATAADIVVDVTLRGDLRMNGWIAVDDVRIVSYWRMRTRKRTLALMQDGSTRDITSDDMAQILPMVVQRQDGTPIMREVNRKYAEMYLASGLDLLEGPYQLPISRLPVFRVPGWEVNVGEWKHRWGLIRFLKDPQRMHNYSRSVHMEKMMQTPRAVWTAADTAVAGREKDWRQSHLSDDPLLVWNAESGQKPERVLPAQIEEAWVGNAEMTAQDLKDVSNIHEANLGMPSNEVSGKAINARVRVSDTGTAIYNDNLGLAIEQAGMVMDELMPFVYDTPRIIKVLGQDGKQDMQIINKMGDPNSIDITEGRYSVTVVTGPSTATKRIEAAEDMRNLGNAAPELMSIFADLYVAAQDWPMADEIARRIRMTLPPGILDPKDMTPEMQQRAQGAAQQAQQQQQMQIQAAVAEYMKTQSETAMNAARARNFEAQADAAGPKLQNESLTAASMAAERELKGHLEAVRVADGK
jgi:hypothetical protein